MSSSQPTTPFFRTILGDVPTSQMGFYIGIACSPL
jgi:hypothetical protein